MAIITKERFGASVQDADIRMVPFTITAPASASAVDFQVPVPFEGRLIGGKMVAATNNATAASISAAVTVDIERGSAGGTTLGTFSLAVSSASTCTVGTVADLTINTSAGITSRVIDNSYVNLEIGGGSTADANWSTGVWNGYLVFLTGKALGV